MRNYEAYQRGLAAYSDIFEILDSLNILSGKYANKEYFVYDSQDFLSSTTRKVLRRKREKRVQIPLNANINNYLQNVDDLTLASEQTYLYSESIQGNKRSRVLSEVTSNSDDFLKNFGYVEDGISQHHCGITYSLKDDLKVTLLRAKDDKEFVIVELSCLCTELNFNFAYGVIQETMSKLENLVRFRD